MADHPARQIARMVEDAAAELGGYLDPGDPFPWELTEDDHRAILPLLDRAIAALSACIDGISQATAGDYAKQQLTDGNGRLLSGCTDLRLKTVLSDPGAEPDEEPVITTQPARLSAADFPAVMSAGVLQAASRPPVLASGPPWSRPRVHARAARSRAAPRPGKRPRRPRQAVFPHTEDINLTQINIDHLVNFS